MAIVLALLLKAFIVEAYKIPTGSMQPTLMGDPQNGVFDRMLVDRFSLRVREPERFEVVVFRYPLDRSKNFVKRLVGMPGEELRIRYGDLWVRDGEEDEWRIVRRPRRVQEEHWRRLDPLQVETPLWRPLSAGADGWSFEGREIRARGEGRARYGPDGSPVVDDYFHGYPDALRPPPSVRHPRSGHHFVGDLRLTGRVTALPGLDWVTFDLTEGPWLYRARIPGPTGSDDAQPTLEIVRTDGSFQPRLVTAPPYRLPAARSVRFSFENLDDRLTLELDGREVLTSEVDPVAEQRAHAMLALGGEGADFADLMVWRDIYFTDMRGGSYQIPEGHYFMLGDNTQDSSDSREWSFARYRLPDGDLVRGNFRRGENPQLVVGRPGGPELWMVDEWGEMLRMPRSDVQELSPEDAPFVERSLIVGRAIAVFWPIQPQKSVWRLKWVR